MKVQITIDVHRQDGQPMLRPEAEQIAYEVVREGIKHLGDDGEYDYEVLKDSAFLQEER